MTGRETNKRGRYNIIYERNEKEMNKKERDDRESWIKYTTITVDNLTIIRLSVIFLTIIPAKPTIISHQDTKPRRVTSKMVTLPLRHQKLCVKHSVAQGIFRHSTN